MHSPLRKIASASGVGATFTVWAIGNLASASGGGSLICTCHFRNFASASGRKANFCIPNSPTVPSCHIPCLNGQITAPLSLSSASHRHQVGLHASAVQIQATGPSESEPAPQKTPKQVIGPILNYRHDRNLTINKNTGPLATFELSLRNFDPLA